VLDRRRERSAGVDHLLERVAQELRRCPRHRRVGAVGLQPRTRFTELVGEQGPRCGGQHAELAKHGSSDIDGSSVINAVRRRGVDEPTERVKIRTVACNCIDTSQQVSASTF